MLRSVSLLHIFSFLDQIQLMTGVDAVLNRQENRLICATSQLGKCSGKTVVCLKCVFSLLSQQQNSNSSWLLLIDWPLELALFTMEGWWIYRVKNYLSHWYGLAWSITSWSLSTLHLIVRLVRLMWRAYTQEAGLTGIWTQIPTFASPALYHYHPAISITVKTPYKKKKEWEARIYIVGGEGGGGGSVGQITVLHGDWVTILLTSCILQLQRRELWQGMLT